MKSAGENASDSSLIGSSLSANVEPLNEDAAGKPQRPSLVSLNLASSQSLPDVLPIFSVDL